VSAESTVHQGIFVIFIVQLFRVTVLRYFYVLNSTEIYKNDNFRLLLKTIFLTSRSDYFVFFFLFRDTLLHPGPCQLDHYKTHTLD